MKKLIITIIILQMIIAIFILPNKSQAVFSIDKADLYSKGTYSDYLRFGGMGIVFDYVVYQKDGQEYPAYCLNKDLKGASSSLSYSVNVNTLLTDVKIWRTIINGYPYKTPEELGCNTKEEAFLATKQAVYCAIYDRDPNTYIATDEIGERTKNALIQIVTNARNSTEIKQSADLEIEEVTEKWEQDIINKRYLSKKFKINANSTINSYSVKLEELNIDGVKIVNENNEEKTEFNYGEIFKIIIPIKNITADGNFNIKVNGKVATKPILYGYSSDPNLQDYALTGNIYEDGSGEKKVYYTKNETKIKILKLDEQGNPLEGVKFSLLDENKSVIQAEFITDKEGKIIIQNIIPGTYYLEETKALNGYSEYEELIELNLSYNEALTLTVTNEKETITIEEPLITENYEEVILKTPQNDEPIKLPKTGM